MKEIRELTKVDNAILGDLDHLYIDWANMCWNHAIEMRFPDIINNCTLE